MLATAACLSLSGLAAPAVAQGWIDPTLPTATPNAVAEALRAQIAGGETNAEIAAFYRDRDYRPIWAPGPLRPHVDRLAEQLGVDARAAQDDPWRLAEVELAISTAYGASATSDTPRPEVLAYVDPLLKAKRPHGRAALEAAARANSVADLLEPQTSARNRIYEELADGLDRYRLQWAGLPETPVAPGPELRAGSRGARVDQLRVRLGLPETGEPFDPLLESAVRSFQKAHGLEPSGRANAATIKALNAGAAHYERLIETNLARAEALPASLGDRFILVDAAAGRLWLYDQGQELATMKVVIGKPSQPTPIMAGMARHLIFNPYWNVPEDLVRTSIAPKVLSRGLDYIAEEGLEVLSDYTDNAVVLDPTTVDWQAVRDGELSVRVRQRPGPKNMMGKVKLMLPNPLGIYLHDTPHKGDFARSERLASSGCVRLEDAMTLARLLVGEATAESALAASDEEQRVDLGEPVPVYITYFTAMPTEEGFEFRPDVYGRDAAWAAEHAANAGQTSGF